MRCRKKDEEMTKQRAPRYTTPTESPKTCDFGDPTCPCQDGLMCHYKGDNPWPPPKERAPEPGAEAVGREQRMSAKKYLLIAGNVYSKTDGDRHWISAPQLARLYGVDPKECVFADELRPETWQGTNLRILRPRFDGDYRL